MDRIKWWKECMWLILTSLLRIYSWPQSFGTKAWSWWLLFVLIVVKWTIMHSFSFRFIHLQLHWTYWFCSVQYSWSLWVILEGTWLCQAFVEAQARVEGRRCWYCCFVWAGMLCLVLCRWDCGKGFYYHWLQSLRITTLRGLNV